MEGCGSVVWTTQLTLVGEQYKNKGQLNTSFNTNWVLFQYSNAIEHIVGCLSRARGHDDFIKWKHFQRYWPFVWGIDRSPVNSPHKRQ